VTGAPLFSLPPSSRVEPPDKRLLIVRDSGTDTEIPVRLSAESARLSCVLAVFFPLAPAASIVGPRGGSKARKAPRRERSLRLMTSALQSPEKRGNIFREAPDRRHRPL